MTIIFEGLGSSTTSDVVVHRGGSVQIETAGDLGGGTLKFQISQDDLVMQDHPTSGVGTLLVPTLKQIALKAGVSYQFAFTGATSTSDVTVSII